MVKTALKWFFNKLGLVVSVYNKPVLVTNYFKTNYPKSVLLSYIVNPFIDDFRLSHTNYNECYCLAEIFDQLGYRVDAINYNDEITDVDFNKYDIIFGFGEPLERSFYVPSLKGTLRVYYGTGNHFHFINPASINRVKKLYEKTGVLMVISARYATKMWSLQNILSDAMIVLGNGFTAQTYRATFKNNIYTLPASFYKVMDIDLSQKNFANARNNFLWFGSNGVVHKGLDILLEIFDKQREINLHICGLKPYESEFVKYYSDLLSGRDNIKNYGFIELKSPQFAELMMQCAFVIFPSASEGGCASVITVMGNGGLIPIVSTASAIDLEDFGIEFKTNSVEDVEQAISAALQWDNDQLLQKSKAILNFTEANHSVEQFKSRAKTHIQSILDEK